MPSISQASPPPSGRVMSFGARSLYFSGRKATKSGGVSRCPSPEMTWYLRPMRLLPVQVRLDLVSSTATGAAPPVPSARGSLGAGEHLAERKSLVGVRLAGQAEGTLADHVLVDLVAPAGDRHATHEVAELGVAAGLRCVVAPEQPLGAEDVEGGTGGQLHHDGLLVLRDVGDAGDVAPACCFRSHARRAPFPDPRQGDDLRQLLTEVRIAGAAVPPREVDELRDDEPAVPLRWRHLGRVPGAELEEAALGT